MSEDFLKYLKHEGIIELQCQKCECFLGYVDKAITGKMWCYLCMNKEFEIDNE